jgi:hypothetical protein
MTDPYVRILGFLDRTVVISHYINGREKNSKDDYNIQPKMTMKHIVLSVKMERPTEHIKADEHRSKFQKLCYKKQELILNKV